MKKRLGFVSNSSSASYYVTLKGPIDSVLSRISEACVWPYLVIETLIKEINRRIRIWKQRIDILNRRIQDIEEKREKFLMLDTKSELENKIKDLEDKKEILQDIAQKRTEGEENWNYKNEELIKIALELNYIEVEEKANAIKLEFKTVMHNNYVDGMPDMLKDIVLFYTFQYPNEISLRIEHNS